MFYKVFGAFLLWETGKENMKKENHRIKKTRFLVFSLCMMFIIPFAVYAKEPTDTEVYSASEQKDTQSEDSKNVRLASGVTKEMCNSSFWSERAVDPDRILMSKNEIATLNSDILKTPETRMNDLENIDPVYNGTALKNQLANTEIPARTYYINGQELTDKDTYFQNMKKNIAEAQTTTTDTVKYAVAVKCADIKTWPTSDVLGYSADDADDELQSSSLCVNEPFIVKTVTADGKFCWGYSTSYTGWVETGKLAICASKAEWTDAWKVDIHKTDYVVVTTNKITLEDSNTDKSTANVMLTLGTLLKEVPDDQIPTNIEERGTWNNYVVYLPTRDEDGHYVKKYALISMHYKVSEGYLNLTQRNVMDTAFECLGDRYGWGGMLSAVDCSGYARMIYRCFGLEIPRDTSVQQSIPGHKTDISTMTDKEKVEFLKTVPAGSLVYMNGHVVVYTGNYKECAYAISATGSLADTPENSALTAQYNVILNPLTVKRRNGETWLKNMISVITFGKIKDRKQNENVDLKEELSRVSLSNTVYQYNGRVKTPAVTVRNKKGVVLKNQTDYKVSYAAGRKNVGTYKITVKGAGNYKGTVTKSFKINPAKTTITKISKGTKSFNIKWKKRTAQVTGYQIRYSLRNNMSDAKKVTIKTSKITSKTIKKLKNKKTYYVQIRTYKKVLGKTYYSSWSSKKKIRV